MNYVEIITESRGELDYRPMQGFLLPGVRISKAVVAEEHKKTTCGGWGCFQYAATMFQMSAIWAAAKTVI